MATTRTQELKRRSLEHIFHTHGPVGEIDLIFEKGKGIILTDTDGKEYMDMCSFYGCASLGYDGREEIINAASEQMKKLSFTPTNVPYSNIPAIEYAEALANFTPKNINRFHFCSGGSDVVELAIKIAKAYWYFRGKASKYKVICLMGSYHGVFYLSGSLTASIAARGPFGPEAPGVVRIPHYHCYRCPFRLKYPDCGIRCATFLEDVVEQEGEDSIAAFIAEPVHSWTGGPPVPEYWPIVREICTKHDILLIADEIVTGFWRTGKNFGMDNWNVQPDLMTMAKGMSAAYFPISGMGISEEVYSVFPGQALIIGQTHPGNVIGCAVAKAVLDIYVRERIGENATKVGNHVMERLEREFLPLPNVGNVAGLGLELSIEIVADKETKRRFPAEMNICDVIQRRCRGKGLFARALSGLSDVDMVIVIPPLIITKEEVDKELDIMYPILASLEDLKAK
jgi:adenosylmethionine-8-amino-7-oxononanoate aminotransferase